MSTIQLWNIDLINYMQSILKIWSYILIHELNDYSYYKKKNPMGLKGLEI